MSDPEELQAALQRLSGTNLDAQGAANAWAGTSGQDLASALNAKAGTVGLEPSAALRRITGRDTESNAALSGYTDTATGSGYAAGYSGGY